MNNRSRSARRQAGFKCKLADPDTARELTGGRCPLCGDDLVINWGRKPNTTVITHGNDKGCKWAGLVMLTWFRQRRYSLSLPDEKPAKVRKAISAEASIAYRALTPSERAIYETIRAALAAGEPSPTYADFEGEGIRKAAIAAGQRVLEALGLIKITHARPSIGKRYESNAYELDPDGWRRFEPVRGSARPTKAALTKARAIASAARKSRFRPSASGYSLDPPLRPSENGTRTYQLGRDDSLKDGALICDGGETTYREDDKMLREERCSGASHIHDPVDLMADHGRDPIDLVEAAGLTPVQARALVRMAAGAALTLEEEDERPVLLGLGLIRVENDGWVATPVGRLLAEEAGLREEPGDGRRDASRNRA